MNINLQHALLIILIVLVVTIPPVICYMRFVHHSESSGCHNSSQPALPNGTDTSSEKSNEIPVQPSKDFTILIDPGHGGYDPGKVSPDGIKEKDINLSISEKLYKLLCSQGYSARLTRSSDASLDSPESSSKKNSDLRNRTDMASDINADLYISIHQNSYSAEYIHGAQVFYYSTSIEGKELAECIQEHLISEVDPENTRSAKGNSDYMVLTESPCTSVIVECGFLSNTAECSKLCTDSYQKQLATAICNAINDWVSTHK